MNRTQRAWRVLEAVPDPEIPVVSIRELGILREINDVDGELEVVITPTYSGCPAMGQIEDDVRAALAANDLGAKVVTRLAPAWTTDWISRGGPAEAARLRDCAAPHGAAGQGRAFRAARGEPARVKCPAPAAALPIPRRPRTSAPPPARPCTSAFIASSRSTTSSLIEWPFISIRSPSSASAPTPRARPPSRWRFPTLCATAFVFRPGQFLTLRATIAGEETRRSYSICSPCQRYLQTGEIDIGIKPVDEGSFSRWALAQLKPGMAIEAMPPDGRFTPRIAGARHRVGFAAGSGITPMLSIIATTLDGEPDSSFTLVYGNQRINTIMFNEALQDLKDRYPARLSLIHLLSRQAQELELLNGRIDEAKVAELLRTVVPAGSIDEAFLCGPAGMIDSAQRALIAAGVPADRVHSERFIPASPGVAKKPPEKSATLAAADQRRAPSGRGARRQDPPSGHARRREGARHRIGCRAGPSVLLSWRSLLHLPRPSARRRGRDGKKLHPGAGGDRQGFRADLPGCAAKPARGRQLRRSVVPCPARHQPSRLQISTVAAAWFIV